MSWRSYWLASSLLAASSTAPLVASAQSRVRETGTFQVSQHVLWIRGTDQGVVQLFVARGFRDALARPHNLNPDAILSWSDSLAKLRAALRAAAGKEIVVSTTGLASDGTVLQRQVGGRFPGLSITLGGGETLKLIEAATPAFTVALEEAVKVTREFSPRAAVASEDTARVEQATPVASDSPAREMPLAPPMVAATPEASAPVLPVTPPAHALTLPATSTEPQASPPAPTEAQEQKRPDAVETTLSTSLEQQPVAVKANASTVVPEPVGKRSSAKASVAAKAATQPVQKKVSAATPEPVREPVREPPSATPVVATVPQRDSTPSEASVPVLPVTPPAPAPALPAASNEPQAPPPASTEAREQKQPEAVEATPSAPLEQQPLAVKADVRTVVPEPVRKRSSAKTSVAGKATTRPVQKTVAAATPEVVRESPATPPVAREPVRQAPAVKPVVATVPKRDSTPSDKRIDLPLGEVVVPAAMLRDRNAQVQYCYRQVGFKYDSQLAGQLIVRVTLGDGGIVTGVKVIRRDWDGVSAGEVESCIRALIRDWTFAANDPSVAGGTTEFTFTFKP